MIGAMTANLPSASVKAQSPPIAPRVLAWWDRHRRTLPWRAERGCDGDPYLVWLSEILLQQTTVQAVIPYFERFRKLWPRVEDLAAAPLEDIMRAFAGLGYYSRARNLHACAREIARRGGAFPRSEAELRTLPGIGAYTAAAVAAIAFNEPTAPVDGNIARIIARLHAIELPIARARSAIAEAAAALATSDRPGDFAQALMDIGATICTPRNPACPACPMQSACAAFAAGDPGAYPRKAIGKPRPHRRGAAFFAQAADGSILLRTRPPRGLLGGTLELPGTSWSPDYQPDEAMREAPLPASWRQAPGCVEHVFSHFSLALTIYVARLSQAPPAHGDCVWMAPDAIEGAALSSLMRKAVAHGLDFVSGAAPVNRRRNGPSAKTWSAR
jgi:A/G-specific adenine glycosylase